MSRTATRWAAAFTALAITLGSSSPAGADAVSDGQWFHSFLRTAEAHRLTEGAGVTVAVIDSGVDATHPDLRDSVLPGADLTEQGPGNGHTDTDGHGTAMAGFIAGHGRVRGIAPAAKILPVRESTDGSGTTEGILHGVEWATAHGADVISISLADEFDDPRLRTAVAQAFAADIVVVAGAGNKPDTRVLFPAAIPGVVAVGGVDKNGEHSSISVSGFEMVIAAPSDNMASTGLNHEYQIGTGTSGATAIVAGAAALVRAKYPELSAVEVVHRLTATAVDKIPAGRDAKYGYGVLDLVAALTADVPPLTSPEASKNPGTPTDPKKSTWLWWVGGVVVVGLLVFVGVRSRRRE